MELFFFTFGGLVAAFTLLGLGVLLGRAPLRRGCGGLGAEACEACTQPCARRRARAEHDGHEAHEEAS